MAAGAGTYTDPYDTYPNSHPGAPSQPSGAGTRHVGDTLPTGNPYPQYGDEGAQMLPSESKGSSQKFGGGAGQYNPPYSLHGLQYSLDRAMGASKDMTHFQSGDIRKAADMSGGSKVSENPGKVAAVSAALDAAAGGRVKGASMGNQGSAFKQAQKGAKAGRPAKDMRLRHAGTQADVTTASTGY